MHASRAASLDNIHVHVTVGSLLVFISGVYTYEAIVIIMSPLISARMRRAQRPAGGRTSASVPCLARVGKFAEGRAGTWSAVDNVGVLFSWGNYCLDLPSFDDEQ